MSHSISLTPMQEKILRLLPVEPNSCSIGAVLSMLGIAVEDRKTQRRVSRSIRRLERLGLANSTLFGNWSKPSQTGGHSCHS